MQSAPSTLPATPPRGLTAGLDWATADHAVAVVDPAGRQVHRWTVPHSDAGLTGLVRRLRALGVAEIAIERPDGPVVTTLLDAGLTVVVIPPQQVKNLRGRYGSAGNKDDRFDAFVLADTLRTDRARLRPLTLDSPATRALRAACRARKDLVEQRVALSNQLSAHLQTALPGALGLFSDLFGRTSLQFLTRFDAQDRVDWLSPTRLGAWLRSVGYSGRVDPQVLHARLIAAPRGPVGEHGRALAHITHAMIAVLRALNEQIAALVEHIDAQLSTHPDQPIFTSLPRSGRVRAARLLAELGDCRARFPAPDVLSCLSGVAPSTRQSGKHRTVSFRYGADKQLRDALCDFAADSRHDNAWAADIYDRAIARNHTHQHAVRILARAWVTVLWRCWQNNTPYDPDQHNALQRVLATQATRKTAAA